MWMTYFLLLNSAKLEVIMLGPKHLRMTLSNDKVMLDSITIASFTVTVHDIPSLKMKQEN